MKTPSGKHARDALLADQAQPLRITVLRGGPGAEREVSLVSGRRVAAALRLFGHHVSEADISPADISALELSADVIFIALHGTFGEDGQLQKLLEERNVPFTGSDAAASALAMDKVRTKARCVAAGIPTPRFDVLKPARRREAVARWALPAVVKPIAGGSSVDCHIITAREQFGPAVESLIETHGECLIEEYVGGYEITVGILDREALPPIWIRTPRQFYDYDAKYRDEATEYLFDIPLSEQTLRRVRALSEQAFAVCGCRDFGRVDWMVDGVTHEPYLLEINTIPGLTDHSLLPKAAAQVGTGFADLCHQLARMAYRRGAASVEGRAAG
jgi:D-alanine-D-alanine ligase